MARTKETKQTSKIRAKINAIAKTGIGGLNMTITVKLFATLRMYGEKEQKIASETSLTPSDIIDRLRLPGNEVAIVMINGCHALIDTALNDGDILALFPAVGGG